MSERWIRSSSELPPEGVEVSAMTPSGDVFQFKRRGRIWLIGPEFDTYVYYDPEFWREQERKL